jgi:adenosylhomocysteine nucleosidase
VIEAGDGALQDCSPSVTAEGIADDTYGRSENGDSIMTIGIICAIPQELGHLAEAMGGVVGESHGGLEFARGTLDGHEVVLAGGGVGKVNAAITATLLADRFACRCLVFSGVAGGLDPTLHVGDVVIGALTLQHDAGVLQGGRVHTYQAGHVPFFNPTDQLGYRPPADLLARVSERLEGFTLAPLSAAAAGGAARTPAITLGTILTGDQFLNCEATRERLFSELGGQAIEMEGGAVGQVAQAFGIPHLVIRALSDLAGTESQVDFGRFVEEVAAASAAIMRRLLPVL